ncbi:MAG: U32 family peptidase [Bacteroidales bacterium]|jgi:putative protease|nr:U32 family peptidase [Bacteroidales bacterium]
MQIELLSPAKNYDCGVAAIQHGADAVYIGAAAFGARAAAANSLADIARLIDYAHQFHARVYVALNTILFDHEINDAVQLCWQLHEIGADALIIQDLGLLASNLPPIPLHASTQLNNRTAEKVQFLESVGFSQVVLARELSLTQIQEIRTNTKIALECFVHGAVCVCYSGQCYLSAYAQGRSGNRGVCSQMCRHKYKVEGLGESFEAYALSPMDLHLGHKIPELMAAGVTSFKIEGRLKDSAYVKNTTAYFRRILDAEIAKNLHYRRASQGVETVSFTPDIHKTFARAFTDYYIEKPRNTIADLETPKARGEYLGNVAFLQGKTLRIETAKTLHNGDGLCFIDSQGELQGVRVNSAKNGNIELSQNSTIPIGTQIWRNYSADFHKQVEQSENCRHIEVDALFCETEHGYALTLNDDYGNSATIEEHTEAQQAKNPEKAEESVRTQLRKSGDTIFTIRTVEISWRQPLFIPIAALNELRRSTLNKLQSIRLQNFITPPFAIVERSRNKGLLYPLPHDTRLNCANEKAQEFFKHHGVENPAPAFEIEQNTAIPLMTTKYCLRFETGNCPRTNKNIPNAQEVYISDNKHRFRLSFNCAQCEMNVCST